MLLCHMSCGMSQLNGVNVSSCKHSSCVILPCTRGGRYLVNVGVQRIAGTDRAAVHRHLLDVDCRAGPAGQLPNKLHGQLADFRAAAPASVRPDTTRLEYVLSDEL